MKQKIISGEFRYCCRAAKSWLAMGYRIAKSKRWGDGKYTFVLVKKDDGMVQTSLDIFD